MYLNDELIEEISRNPRQKKGKERRHTYNDEWGGPEKKAKDWKRNRQNQSRRDNKRNWSEE